MGSHGVPSWPPESSRLEGCPVRRGGSPLLEAARSDDYGRTRDWHRALPRGPLRAGALGDTAQVPPDASSALRTRSCLLRPCPRRCSEAFPLAVTGDLQLGAPRVLLR